MKQVDELVQNNEPNSSLVEIFLQTRHYKGKMGQGSEITVTLKVGQGMTDNILSWLKKLIHNRTFYKPQLLTIDYQPSEKKANHSPGVTRKPPWSSPVIPRRGVQPNRTAL